MIRTFKQVAKYVYETLGPGHEEAIYRDAMSVELQDRGYTVKTEAPISIRYKTKKGKEMIVGSGKIDLYVTKGNNYSVIELKTVGRILKEKGSKNLRKRLRDNECAADFAYPYLHQTQYYNYNTPLMNLDDLDDRIINLPIHQNLSAIEVSKIVGVING